MNRRQYAHKYDLSLTVWQCECCWLSHTAHLLLNVNMPHDRVLTAHWTKSATDGRVYSISQCLQPQRLYGKWPCAHSTMNWKYNRWTSLQHNLEHMAKFTAQWQPETAWEKKPHKGCNVGTTSRIKFRCYIYLAV